MLIYCARQAGKLRRDYSRGVQERALEETNIAEFVMLCCNVIECYAQLPKCAETGSLAS